MIYKAPKSEWTESGNGLYRSLSQFVQRVYFLGSFAFHAPICASENWSGYVAIPSTIRVQWQLKFVPEGEIQNRFLQTKNAGPENEASGKWKTIWKK